MAQLVEYAAKRCPIIVWMAALRQITTIGVWDVLLIACNSAISSVWLFAHISSSGMMHADVSRETIYLP